MGEEDRENALAAILPGKETVILEGKMNSLENVRYRCMLGCIHISLYFSHGNGVAPSLPIRTSLASRFPCGG